MNENEILEQIREEAKEDADFFGNPGKIEREKWCVAEFLKIIGIEYSERELNSLEQASKIDISFREANFQVKELTEPGFLRTKMYRDKYNASMRAKSVKDMFFTIEPRDLSPETKMHEIVLENARELGNTTYKNTKSELDLLVYITRTRSSLIQEDEIESDSFSSLGWRSVSCFNTKQAVVLFAADSAPQFLSCRAKKLFSNDNY